MRWRWRIRVIGLSTLFCYFLVVVTLCRQARAGEREQAIVEIQQLIEDKNLEEAQRLLEAVSRQFPQDAGLDNLRGVIAAQQGDYKGAEAGFTDAVTRSPKFTGAYMNLGRLYQENTAADPHAPQKALDVYARVLHFDPDNREANYQSAALLLEQRRFKESLGHLLRLPPQSQNSAQVHSLLCADYSGLGDRKHADDASTRLLADPDFSEQDVEDALTGLLAGKRDDLIITLLGTLQNRHPLSPAASHTLGLAYERTTRLAEARAALEEAANTNFSVTGLLELARVAHKQQDYRGSLGYLAHARDLEPNDPRLHYYFGRVCLDLDLIAEAHNSFEKAVTLEPDNPSYNYALGAASTFRQNPEEALPYFEKYLKLRPQDPRGALAMGVVFWRAKNFDAAVPWFRQAVSRPETAATAHYYLGSIALRERRFDNAHAELELALKSKPDYPDALAQLGQYYLERKDYREAEKHIGRALEIDPDQYMANFALLTLYTRTGDARREAQAKRFEQLKDLLDEKAQELLRTVEVRPFETP
jgi:tetratricopeptide (TPR) repeat protein